MQENFVQIIRIGFDMQYADKIFDLFQGLNESGGRSGLEWT